LVFGKRCGDGAADYAAKVASSRPTLDDAAVDHAAEAALLPFNESGSENPYTVQKDLQETMQSLVGIIRRESELQQSLAKLQEMKKRLPDVSVEGNRVYNPGWHLAIDLHNMLIVSECIATAALERTESRGGHTREDHPGASDDWAKINLVLTLDADGEVELARQPLPQMPDELVEHIETQG
jgi:succinate dehydrogenase / fumarate reductase flavoprotein subunit